MNELIENIAADQGVAFCEECGGLIDKEGFAGLCGDCVSAALHECLDDLGWLAE